MLCDPPENVSSLCAHRRPFARVDLRLAGVCSPKKEAGHAKALNGRVEKCHMVWLTYNYTDVAVAFSCSLPARFVFRHRSAWLHQTACVLQQ